MYDGLIFDKDGVLIDSGLNDFKWMDQRRRDAAKEEGFELNEEDSQQIVHANDSKIVEEVLERRGMDWSDLKKIELKVQEKKKEFIRSGKIGLFPQVKEVLNDLELEKAVATNAPKDITDFTFEHFDLYPYFSKVNSPSMKNFKKFFERKKPKPTMLEEVIEDRGFDNPLMIGDTETDIKAARNAGIDVVHLKTNGFTTNTEPDYRVQNIIELKHLVEENLS